MQIAEQVGDAKSPEDCETLFRQHQGYLSLNVEYHSDVVFATMVHDHFNAVPQKVSDKPDQSQLALCSRDSCTQACIRVCCPLCVPCHCRCCTFRLCDCGTCS